MANITGKKYKYKGILIISLVFMAGCVRYPDYQPRPIAPEPQQRPVQPGNQSQDDYSAEPEIQPRPPAVRPAGSGEYWVYDPEHPEADAQGYVLVSVNRPEPIEVKVPLEPDTPVRRVQRPDLSDFTEPEIVKQPEPVISSIAQEEDLPRPIVHFKGIAAAEEGQFAANQADEPANQQGNMVASDELSQLLQPVLIRDTSIHQVIADLEALLQTDSDNLYCRTALQTLYAAVGREGKMGQGDEKPDLDQLYQAVILTLQSQQANNSTQANEALQAVQQLAQKLARQADLEITELKICGPDARGNSSIKGFGRYEEQPLAYLETGNAQTVWVYCQVENFLSQQDNTGLYFSSLYASITLFDANYNPLVKLDGEVPDSPVAAPRRDFFIQGRLNIPKLSPGRYEIKVEISDKLANKRAKPQYYTFTVR